IELVNHFAFVQRRSITSFVKQMPGTCHVKFTFELHIPARFMLKAKNRMIAIHFFGNLIIFFVLELHNAEAVRAKFSDGIFAHVNQVFLVSKKQWQVIRCYCNTRIEAESCPKTIAFPTFFSTYQSELKRMMDRRE